MLTQETALFYIKQIHSSPSESLNSNTFTLHASHHGVDIKVITQELIEQDLIETETAVDDGNYFLTTQGYNLIEEFASKTSTKQEEYVAYADAISANKPLTKLNPKKFVKNGIIFLIAAAIVTGLILYNQSVKEEGEKSGTLNETIDFLDTKGNLYKLRDTAK